jgi:hypothetical protein
MVLFGSIVIDVYSKFAQAYPLKSKPGQEVTASLLTFFRTFDPLLSFNLIMERNFQILLLEICARILTLDLPSEPK